MARGVVDIDLGHDRIVRVLERLDGQVLEVGYFPDAIRDEGTPQALIAAVQEHGSVSRRIPPRPTLGTTADRKAGSYAVSMELDVYKAMRGRGTIEGSLHSVGADMVSDVVQAITDKHDPPNAPSTIAQKGANNPLIDTGIMRASVDYRVRRPGT